MREEDIRKYLTTETFGKVIYPFEVLDSTNTKAKALALDAADEGTMVISEEQTSGRGRMGRTWLSERGKNLTFSLIVRPRIPPQMVGLLSLCTGVAVARALSSAVQVSVTCKWPNDLQVEGKKCCGILSEGLFVESTLSAVVIGIGLNVNQIEFPDELHDHATSLALQAGHNLDRFKLLAIMLREIELEYGKIQSASFDGILDEWMRYSPMMGKEITIQQKGKSIHGIASRLAPDGGLIVQTKAEEVKFLAGDVKVIE